MFVTAASHLDTISTARFDRQCGIDDVTEFL
jgi:hypothetical protein